VSSLILFWASKEKLNQTNYYKPKSQNLVCYLDLLYFELWETIISYLGINLFNDIYPLQIENWFTLRSVSKLWFNRLEEVQFKSICINTELPKLERNKYESNIWKLPPQIIQTAKSFKIIVTNPKLQCKSLLASNIHLRFSHNFLPLPEVKELKFVISDEFETPVIKWEPNKIRFPSRKVIFSKIPSLQAIEIVHLIVAEKKHILTFITRIQPNNKTVSTFIMKKEEPFLDFDNVHVRINFSEFGGMSISKVENLILTGKTWSLEELQEFVILLPSLKSLAVDISESKEEEDAIKAWVTRKFGPTFSNRKIENSLFFFDYNQK